MKTTLTHRNLLVLLGGALALMLGACDGGLIYVDAGDPDPTKEQFSIQTIGMSGTSQDVATVSVEGLDDQDGVQDTNWIFNFLLDGSGLAGSLPVDDGRMQIHTLRVIAVRASDQQEFRKKVTITLFD